MYAKASVLQSDIPPYKITGFSEKQDFFKRKSREACATSSSIWIHICKLFVNFGAKPKLT